MPFILVPLSVIALDQILKIFVTKLLYTGESISIIKNIFHITLVENKGAAFGILKNQTLLFIILSVIAILSIGYYYPRFKKAILCRMGLAFILGGAVSNLIDRLRFGYVIDFLDFRIWPVFNVADSAITIGATILIVELLRKNKI